MSLDTWKAEFYPVTAQECTKEDALDHSILKWSGLTAKAMERHEVKLEACMLFDISSKVSILLPHFNIDGGSCALCQRYQVARMNNPCEDCPLAMSRGGISCTHRVKSELESPWLEFFFHGDSKPMRKALAKAQRFVQIQGAK